MVYTVDDVISSAHVSMNDGRAAPPRETIDPGSNRKCALTKTHAWHFESALHSFWHGQFPSPLQLLSSAEVTL